MSAMYAQVLGRTLAEWPQPVSAQVMRTRLTAYKQLLTEENFAQGVCACCARAKRLCRLTPACFPPPDASIAPSWLQWSAEAWERFGAAWHKQVDVVLSAEQYLQTYFQADERVRCAEAAVMTAEAFSSSTCSQRT